MVTCHEPLDAPASAKQFYLDQGLPEGLSTLYGMIHHFDREVGRLLTGMRKLGVLDNTIILFMSDNGPAVNNRALTDAERKTRNINGFKGWKGNLWENGLRSPLFVKWGANFPNGIRSEIVDVTDILPTLLDLAGLTPPDAIDFDGRSFRPLLEGQEKGTWENTHFDLVQPGWQPTDAPWTPEGILDEYAPVEKSKSSLDWSLQPIAVFSGQYKLIRNPGPVEGNSHSVPDRVLFNLAVDSTEEHNLADSHPEKVRNMDEAAKRWFQGIKASPHAFKAPVFRVQPDTTSFIPLFAPVEASGGLKVAFNFLHQLKAGAQATYKIEVEKPGTYSFSFDPPNPTGTYRISTSSGNFVVIKGDEWGELNIGSGSQYLVLEVIESTAQSLRRLDIRPDNR